MARMALPRHLVIMARAPRLGAVKRRLAAEAGALVAWRFYRATCSSLLRRLGRDARWRCWLALTPDAAARDRGGAWPASCTRIAQGGGDLGARMARILRALPPGPAVVVGSDIPDLAAADIAEAFARLGDHDWVFGPARDGGYWLIGARRRPALRPPFSGVRWSSRQALADTVANLPGARVAYLRVLEDVDTAADLARLRARAKAPLSRRGAP